MAGLAGLASLVLAGCAELGAIGLSIGAIGQSAVTVSRGEVTIAGPEGFCVYPFATRDRGTQAFVLLGNCAAITRSEEAPQPPIHALLTAAVRETDAIEVASQSDLLASFLRSETGRAMLSRDKNAATVTILDSFSRGDVLYVHARDESESYAPGMTAEHWRAFLDVDGRIVALAVLGFEADPLSAREGLSAVRDFAEAIRRSNLPPSAEAQ
ncbi:hypothetical protein [Dinoroseobacter sp. S76]|uniref:hypothetical protein n=1 Tax=Dinoroseobacter sp. S76 TaxID=3415124 RepID=UPI003C7B85D7